jgi:archaellum component FlaG (FlaF/FlaG flagellin family)
MCWIVWQVFQALDYNQRHMHLRNYQVSISDKADFSTHTYQQDFHVAPNPKKIIQLNASGKQNLGHPMF